MASDVETLREGARAAAYVLNALDVVLQRADGLPPWDLAVLQHGPIPPPMFYGCFSPHRGGRGGDPPEAEGTMTLEQLRAVLQKTEKLVQAITSGIQLDRDARAHADAEIRRILAEP